MTSWLIVDGLIILAALAALWSGWRQGVIAAALSFVGVMTGLVLGITVAPLAMQLTDVAAVRFLLAVGVLVIFVGLGQVIGATLGARLRDGMKARKTQRIDSAFGAAFQVLAALLVIWLVSIPLASNLAGPAGKGLRESRVLGALNAVAPQQLAALPNGIAAMLNDSGLPPLVSPWQTPGKDVEVAAPAQDVSDPELVRRLRPSVIHVLGDSEECSRRLMGSGFVTEDDYVITNAHVVAGTETVRLDTVLGMHKAEVVYFNPEVDVAVLHAPGLDIEPIEWAHQPGDTGEDAMVMGFPESGPFDAGMARIRDRITIAGPDIYSSGRVERDAYTVRGDVRQGNSGGPMVDTNGDVLGVVFGASVDETDTGYALTAEEVLGHIGEVENLTTPVGTGECVAH